MDNFLVSQLKEIFSISKRIKNRDFKGNSGIAIRNSMYQFAYTFVSKVGSLLFTIIFARLLMPELFGLYSVALGTILTFAYFTDFGAGQTMTRFLSKSLSKNNHSKARAYTLHLFKIKIMLISGILILFLALSKPLALYYQKPIFMILLSGSLYLFSISLAGFFQSFFYSLNDFKTPFIRETFFQILRLVIVPLIALYLLKKSVSGESVLVTVFVLFGIIWAALAFYLFFIAKGTNVLLAKEVKLKSKEKKEVNSFLLSLAAFSTFSIILTYSDIFILGGFVSSEYIGYYQAAMGLVGSLGALVLFSSALFPVFSRLGKDALEGGFRKSARLTIFISIMLFLFTVLFSNQIISLLYGKAYVAAVPFFRCLSFYLILFPLNFMYNGYFMAKGKPNVIRNLLVFVSIFNLVINFSLVYFLSQNSDYKAVLGLIGGTLLSNSLYLIGCIWNKKKLNSINV